MIRKNWASKTEKLFKAGQILGTFLLLFIGAFTKTDLKEYTNWATFHQFWTFNQQWAFVSIPLLTVAVGTVSYLKTQMGANTTWNTVTYLLEKYRKAIFEKTEGFENDPEYHHRITLYKYVVWRWAFCWFPWTGWMVPVARTSHTTHSMRIPRFRVYLQQPDKAEGVAGQAFVQKRIVPVPNLPEIKESSTDAEVEDYAARGFVSKDWVIKKKNKCYIRCLIGIPIEVKNKPWGVMVIDSRRPDAITDHDILSTPQFRTLAEVLGKLLEN